MHRVCWSPRGLMGWAGNGNDHRSGDLVRHRRGIEDLPDYLHRGLYRHAEHRRRVGAITPNRIRAARSLGGNTPQVFLHVVLPATAPCILTGMRLAMGNSFVTIVAAELIAGNVGAGKMIFRRCGWTRFSWRC